MVGQLLARRYRLAMFKGGDDIADVWHALDEATAKVVTLEILRERENEAARQRFLAEAHRMAAIERPSVMRVAAIHNEAAETFIVFEHLIPLPVVFTGLTAVATDGRPSTKAVEDTDKTIVITPAAPQAPQATAPQAPPPVAPQAPPPVAPATLAAVVGPKRSAVAPEPTADDATAPTIVDLDEMPKSPAPSQAAATERLPETLQAASRSLRSARSDMSRVRAWGTRVAEEARLLVRDVGMDTVTADARAFIADTRARVSRWFNTAVVASLVTRATALVTRATARVRGLASRAASGATSRPARPRAASTSEAAPTAVAAARAAPVASAAARAAARAAAPVASAAAPVASAAARAATRAGAAALSSVTAVAMSLAASAAPLIARARGNPVVLAGATAVLFLVVFVASPLDDKLADAFRSAPAPSPTAAPPAALAPAPFELPPLSAYGATFDSQGAYPTTTPSGTVEWVVALRNTGSAGWYRGIEGAQAALALPDGTGVAVQSTEYVAPGQVGWFVVRFRARAEVGTYTVQLRPRIDGRGPLPDLGIYAVVTVSKNP